jgi:preprotein translocase subunit YajC
MGPLIVIVVLAFFAWIFLVLPSRRRQRSHRAMQDSVEVGNEIITAGGIHGTVRELADGDVRLEIAEGVVVTIDRRAIAAVAEDLPLDKDDEHGDDEPGDGEEDDPPDAQEQAEESVKS